MTARTHRTVNESDVHDASQGTLAGALERAWTRWPERPALVFEGRSIPYAQLGKAILTLARAYQRLGIGHGDRVVCSVSNRPEQIIALGAAWMCGAVHVGVDYQSTAPELSSVIAHMQAKALLYEPGDEVSIPFGLLQAVRRHHPDTHLIGVGDHPVPAGFLTLSALIEEGAPTEHGTANSLAGAAPSAPAMIFITSGTTGTPKAAVGYQGNLCHRWQRLAAWLEFGPDDVHLAQLPLSHGFGLMMAVAALLTGGRLVLLRAFSAEEALRMITSERITVLNGAPAHFKLILRRHDPMRHDLHSLRLSVGTAAFFSSSLVRSIWDKLSVRFMFMYGSSEGVGVATTDPDDILRGSVGRPAPGAVAIVGSDRKPLPTGEMGEIAFSRTVYPVQYWQAPGIRESSEAVPEGASSEDTWYYSGDLGRLDEEGRLYVYGRLKHQIDRGGLKIDPVEVEGALLRCPGIVDAAIIGLPNPILGETVCACIVPEPEQVPSLEQLRTMLRSALAPYKLPEALCLLDEIPRTVLGKIDLDRLHDQVQNRSIEQTHDHVAWEE